MNENNYIQTIGENSTLQDSIIENMYLKAFVSISDAENTSKEKYITKTMLIKSSNDMSTQEKLTSLDKNYECRNYERWQNLLYFTIISFSVLGVTVASPIAMKNVHKLCELLKYIRATLFILKRQNPLSSPIFSFKAF